MASFIKVNGFVEAIGLKKINLATDALIIALTNAVPGTPLVLADLTEISYTNLSSRAVSGNAYTQTAGVAKLTATDLVLTASGAVATFRYAWLYSNTATNKDLIGYWDYGSSITMANGETFTIDFDGTNGILQIT